MDTLDVQIGEVKFAQSGKLASKAIGSCIAVASYDNSKRTGALAHIMLPGKAPTDCPAPNRYAVNAINTIVKKMTHNGSTLADIRISLVGAANVLRKPEDTICAANLRSTLRTLRSFGLHISTAALGGTQRRTICLDIESGNIFYTEGDSGQMLLTDRNLAPAII